MEDLNAGYAEELGELNFSKFTSLVMTLKTVNSIYANETVAKYYLILGIEKLHEQFVEDFFESVYNTA